MSPAGAGGELVERERDPVGDASEDDECGDTEMFEIDAGELPGNTIMFGLTEENEENEPLWEDDMRRGMGTL